MKLRLPFNWLWIIIVLGLWVAGRQVVSIVKLYRSGDKMKQAQIEVSQLEVQKADLEKKLASINSPEYIERELRNKLGYGRPGETVFILPKIERESRRVEEPGYTPNWKRWWDLYIRL